MFYTNFGLLSNKKIFLSYYNNGIKTNITTDYNPKLYEKVAYTTNLKDIFGSSYKEIKFNSIKSAVYASFNKEKKYGGYTKFEYPYVIDKFPNIIEPDLNLIKICYFDIETSVTKGFPDIKNPVEQITAITLELDNRYLVLTLKDYDKTKSKFLKDNGLVDSVVCLTCKSEEHLIKTFVSTIKKKQVDILSGWNIEGFDIPYLIARSKFIDIYDHFLTISPFNEIQERGSYQFKEKTTVYSIVGISILDYMNLYKKFEFIKPDSYRLDNIAKIVLDESKLKLKGSFKEQYDNNFQEFVDYNIQDVRLLPRLEAKLGFIKLVIYVSAFAKVNYIDVLNQTKIWENVLYQEYSKNNIVFHYKEFNEKDNKFRGAFVLPPKIGLHSDVVGFDINSLYPNIISQFNVSPETLIRDYSNDYTLEDFLNGSTNINDKNIIYTANGVGFNRIKRGLLPDIIDNLYEKRKEFKKKKIETEKRIEKINLILEQKNNGN